MKNKFILISISFLLSFLYYSIADAQPTFSKRIDVEQWTFPSQLVQLADGGFIISGFYSLDSIGDAQKFCIMKTDELGNLLWVRSADLPIVAYRNNVSSAIGLAATHDSGFVIAIPAKPVFNSSFILAKFDQSGAKQWANQMDGSLDIIGMTVVETQDHGFAVGYGGESITVGITRIDSTGKILWSNGIYHAENGYATPPSAPPIFECSDKGFLVGASTHAKFSSSGEILWSRHDSMGRYSFGYGMTKTFDEGIVTCGLTSTRGNDRTIYAIKYDSSGKKIWGYTFNIFSFAEGQAIAEAGNGDLLITGTTFNELSVLRISNSGQGKFFSKIVLDNNTEGMKLTQTHDKGIAVLGWLQKNRISFDGIQYSILFAKVDSSFNGCYFERDIFTSSSIVAVIDSSSTMVEHSFTDSTAHSLTFSKLNNIVVSDECLGLSVPAQPSDNTTIISLHPNPLVLEKSIILSINGSLHSGSYNISLLDLLGNIIKKQKIDLSGAKQDISIDVSEVSAGVYFVEFQSENDPKIFYRLKFIKK